MQSEQQDSILQGHAPSCPCNNADERGCFLISAETGKCVSCTCDRPADSGPERQHLPECLTAWMRDCICTELRMCEERVQRDMDSVYGQGFQAGRESMLAHFIHRDAEIVRLTRLWHEGVSLDHHKDRDCHWYITVKYSYGGQPTFTASHNGYIGPQWQGEEFTTYAQAAADLKHKLERCIEDRIAWAKEQLVDPYGWFDDDARRLLQVLENTTDNTPDITGQSVVKSADLSDPQMGEMIHGDR